MPFAQSVPEWASTIRKERSHVTTTPAELAAPDQFDLDTYLAERQHRHEQRAAQLADVAPPAGAIEVGEWMTSGMTNADCSPFGQSGAVAAFGIQATDGSIPEPIAVSITTGRHSVHFDDVATAQAVLRDLAAVLGAVDQFDARLKG
jgi:hypothetical protein